MHWGLRPSKGRATALPWASKGTWGHLGQVPQEELVMFAERLGATLAESIMREFANTWWSVLQRMTTYDPEGDCEAPTAPAAGVAPSLWWLWGMSPSSQGRHR